MMNNTLYIHKLENKNIYIEIDSRHDKRFEQATSKVQRTFFICSTKWSRAEDIHIGIDNEQYIFPLVYYTFAV